MYVGGHNFHKLNFVVTVGGGCVSSSYVLARSRRGKQAGLYARGIAYNLNLVSLGEIFN